MASETTSACAATATATATAAVALSPALPSPSTVRPVEQSPQQPINVTNTTANTTANNTSPHNPHGRRLENSNGNNNNSNNNNKRRRRGKQQSAQPPPKEIIPEGCSVCNIVKEEGPPKYKCPKCRASYCSVACCRHHKTVCPGKEGGPVPVVAKSTGEAITATEATSSVIINSAAVNNDDENGKVANEESDDENDYDDDGDGDDSSLEDGWKITDDMKVALRNSTWLRNELQDGGLRDMISSVVRSERKFKSYNSRNRNRHGNRNNHKKNFQQQPPHPHEELAAKRNDNRNFDVFTDKLLVLGDVLERQGAGTLDVNGDNNIGGAAMDRGPPSGRNEEELEEWLRQKWNPQHARPALALKPKQKVIPKFEPIDVSSSEDEEEEKEERKKEPMELKDDSDTKKNKSENIEGESSVAPQLLYE